MIQHRLAMVQGRPTSVQGFSKPLQQPQLVALSGQLILWSKLVCVKSKVQCLYSCIALPGSIYGMVYAIGFKHFSVVLPGAHNEVASGRKGGDHAKD